MNAFVRFPHTPHLAWLGSGTPREDKVLGDAEVREFLSREIIVEEKVDGANLGFSIDEGGRLRAQNRGGYLDLDDPKNQWKPLRRWLSMRQHALAAALAPGLMLFGEWCYAVHSVRYTSLPDWFLAFDVFERATGEFWSVERRNELVRDLRIEVVPEIGRGHFGLAVLKRLHDRSALTDGKAEGLYVRREQGDRLLQRAKLVSSEFIQAIDEHWSKRHFVANQLARTTAL